jgi:predicted MFS family arabinose efflux permease
MAFLFLEGRPAGTSTSAGEAPVVDDRAPTGLTLHEGLGSFKLYRLLLATLFSTFLGAAMVLYLVPILRSAGLSAMTAATVAGMMGFSIIGRLASGWLLDRFAAGPIAAMASLAMLLLPGLLLAMPGSVPAAMVAVLCYALMGGALIPATAYLVSRHFGTRSFGTFYGMINAIHSIGVGLGPLLANYLYDRSGTYIPTLIAAVPMFMIGALLFASLGRYPHFEPAR